jgi:transcriptional regulator with XRE-family HTH domain
MRIHQTPRFCSSCGNKLAVGARLSQCRRCARATAAVTVEGAPPTFPDSFWTTPELGEAFEAQDFGLVLRAYRKICGPKVTQADIAGWLGLSQSQVSRMERGTSLTPDLGKIADWARALKIPQDFLWFSVSTEPSRAYRSAMVGSTLLAAHETDGDEVQRRGFLKIAAAASVRLGSRSNNPDVYVVREMTSTFRKIDNKHGGGHNHVRMAVRSYLDSTKPLTSGHAGTDLLAAKAELYQLAGWIDYDTGHLTEGNEHLTKALQLCREAGNSALEAEMLAAMSHHAAFFSQTNEFLKTVATRPGNSAHGAAAAVSHAAASRLSAKRTGLWALRSEAAAMEAHGLALRGDKQESVKALLDAERAFERIHGQEIPSWLTYFDAAYLSAKFAHTLRDLGQPVEAERFARRSLEMNDGYDRGRLFNTVLLASTIADQRRVEEACEIGICAVQMLDSVRSVRVMFNVADLGQRLVAFQETPQVRALFDAMNERGVQVPGQTT